LNETFIEIQEVGSDAFEPAFCLLQRFFREEGFDTPVEEMRSSLVEMIAAPNSAVFLAWRGEEAAGVATVTTSVGIEYGRSAELEDLYVKPGVRGCGVATALIEAVCTWCSRAGVTAVLVTVTPEGEADHNLIDYYQRRGFTNTGRVILERALRDDSR
jgi:aminoglycoside 6'-N-acetyltransferase I